MNEEINEENRKRALTESFIIDGDIGDSTSHIDINQRPKKKKKKKVKKAGFN